MVVCECPEAECIWLRMIIRFVDDCGDVEVDMEMDVNEN